MEQGTISRQNDLLQADSVLAPWRVLLFGKVLRTVLWVAPIAMMPSILASAREELYVIIVADVAAYIALFPIYRWRTHHYTVASAAFCFLLLAFAGMLVALLGTDGAAMIWIIAPPLIAELLLPGRVSRLVFGATGLCS